MVTAAEAMLEQYISLFREPPLFGTIRSAADLKSQRAAIEALMLAVVVQSRGKEHYAAMRAAFLQLADFHELSEREVTLLSMLDGFMSADPAVQELDLPKHAAAIAEALDVSKRLHSQAILEGQRLSEKLAGAQGT